ncbi:hypothetical protein Sjap_005564 [Stephania japonica]|uniref:Uncharacterized protein n=1 Tax=Stephania japonica TaxID=461633 RepID=A0AAP0PLZ9_9MAGN
MANSSQIRTLFVLLILLSTGEVLYGYTTPTYPGYQMKVRKLLEFVNAELDYVDPHHNTSHEKPGSGG